MTITTEAVYRRDAIQIVEREKLDVFKQALGEGEVVYLTFSDEQPHSGGALRYWHKLRDRYADAMGYDREFAKSELKLRFGDYRRAEDVLGDPPDADGRFVEMYGQLYWLKSLRDYTKAELHTLTERTKAACFENDIDIADLVAEHE